MAEIIYLILVVFFSSLINSTFGFGFALFCMPLLSLQFELDLLRPLIPLLFVVGSTWVVIKDWQHIVFKSIIPLAIGASLGVPIGTYAANYGPQITIKFILGGFIILFSIYNLVTPVLPKLKTDKSASFFGALSGVFAGAYNISGPPAVIYASLRQWPPQAFRASLQCYFLYVTLLVISSHIYMGSYGNSNIGLYFLYAFPAMLIAVPIGKKINGSIKNIVKFNRYVYVLMLLSGLMLILKTMNWI